MITLNGAEDCVFTIVQVPTLRRAEHVLVSYNEEGLLTRELAIQN